jgi:murein DD-endopeptidase MepM/ murein hydrolase activator NlpD
MSDPTRIWLNALIALACVAALMLGPTPSHAQEGGPESPEAGQPAPTVHVVQRGEDLSSIASRYGTTVGAILSANNLSDPALIEVGQRLIIPTTEPLPSGRAIAQAGDSLYSLATRYGISPQELGRLNRIANPALVYAGQSLALPTSGAGAIEPANGEMVTLADGEWLGRLAANTGSNLAALGLANGLDNPLLAVPGVRVAIPGGERLFNALSSPWLAIQLKPLPLERGRSGGLHVQTATPGTLRGSFLAKDLAFVSEGTDHWTMIGVHYQTKPGLYPIALVFEDQAGNTSTWLQNVRVADAQYARQDLTLPETDLELLDPQLVQEEYLYVATLMSGFTPQRYWDDLFALPVTGGLTSAYGTLRSYNGGPYEFHSGADFGGVAGTPIYAPADGVVVTTDELAVRGLTTIIDHGWGVYTGYWHQTTILVEDGQTVSAGQQIGTTGRTGRTTGPHLHWEMWVGGVQVDPLQFVRERFP